MRFTVCCNLIRAYPDQCRRVQFSDRNALANSACLGHMLPHRSRRAVPTHFPTHSNRSAASMGLPGRPPHVISPLAGHQTFLSAGHGKWQAKVRESILFALAGAWQAQGTLPDVPCLCWYWVTRHKIASCRCSATWKTLCSSSVFVYVL